MVADPFHVYELLPKNVRGGYDTVGFADLGEEPQTPLSVFFIKKSARKNLCLALLAIETGRQMIHLLGRENRQTFELRFPGGSWRHLCWIGSLGVTEPL